MVPRPPDEASLHALLPAARALAPAALRGAPGEWSDASRAGTGSEFRDFVPHVPGGDARRIDWRASARRGDAVERRRHAAGVSRWILVLDASRSMATPGSGVAALSVEVTAALGYLLLHLGHEIGWIACGDGVRGRLLPGRGRGHYARLCAALETHIADAGELRLPAVADLLRAGDGVVLISDFLAEDGLAGGLALLRRRGHPLRGLALTPLLGGEGRQGPATLWDVETDAGLAVGDVAAAAVDARARLARQRRGLARQCRRLGIAFSEASAMARWDEAVLGHLRVPVPAVQAR